MIFDLIIIGGGPAGYFAAERAGKAGLNVLLIEKRALGGTCLNEGCIPSKTLLYSAKLYDGAVNGDKYGISVEKAVLDHEAVINRKNKVVRALGAGIKAKMKKYGVEVVQETAEIIGRKEEFFDVRAGDSVYTARRLLIATGSVPSIPPVAGIEDGISREVVLTSREILDLKTVPSSIAIIGGGVIGLEIASYFNTAGSTVSVIEILDHVGGNMDREIAGILKNNYVKKGVNFILNARVTEIRPHGQGADVVYEHEGRSFALFSEKILVSTGRKPATDGLGLERIGVETKHGAVITDEFGRTNIPGVYAAGDVNGKSMLAHTAYREAEACINHMIGRNDAIRYDTVPYVIYTNPEAAGVGETENSARQKGIEFETAKLPMTYSGRYCAENERGDGICKVLIRKKDRMVMGVHMVGSYSSEIIYGAGIMVEKGMRVEEISKFVFPHPTVCEIIREALFEVT